MALSTGTMSVKVEPDLSAFDVLSDHTLVVTEVTETEYDDFDRVVRRTVTTTTKRERN